MNMKLLLWCRLYLLAHIHGGPWIINHLFISHHHQYSSIFLNHCSSMIFNHIWSSINDLQSSLLIKPLWPLFINFHHSSITINIIGHFRHRHVGQRLFLFSKRWVSPKPNSRVTYHADVKQITIPLLQCNSATDWILDTGCQNRPMPESPARIPEILIDKLFLLVICVRARYKW